MVGLLRWLLVLGPWVFFLLQPWARVPIKFNIYSKNWGHCAFLKSLFYFVPPMGSVGFGEISRQLGHFVVILAVGVLPMV